jgi:hypothetical protein
MKDDNLFTVGNLVQFIKLNEAIGEAIEAKFKNVPKDIEIHRKRNTFNIQFGRSVKAFNHFVKQYQVYLTFELSEDPEGDIYEIHDEPLFDKYNNRGNHGFFTVRNEAELKRLGKFISELFEANGIKLTPLSKAQLEFNRKEHDRLIDQWVKENIL